MCAVLVHTKTYLKILKIKYWIFESPQTHDAGKSNILIFSPLRSRSMHGCLMRAHSVTNQW